MTSIIALHSHKGGNGKTIVSINLAAMLVKIASQYACDIFIMKEGLEINGKSIMGVMMLAAEIGSEITIRTEGKDEDLAMEALMDLFDNKFGED